MEDTTIIRHSVQIQYAITEGKVSTKQTGLQQCINTLNTLISPQQAQALLWEDENTNGKHAAMES